MQSLVVVPRAPLTSSPDFILYVMDISYFSGIPAFLLPILAFLSGTVEVRPRAIAFLMATTMKHSNLSAF